MKNNKLNIFEYYTQEGIIPIENNSSRNLSIIMKNCNTCKNRIMNLVEHSINNIKSENNSTKSTFSFPKVFSRNDEIYNQIYIKTLKEKELDINEIVGVTLTTNENIDFSNFISPKTNNTKNAIPDIVMIYRNTLVIFEVKRNNIDASNQLKEQIDEYIDDSEEFKVWFSAITWKNVIEELQKVNDEFDRENYLLNDYLEHVEYRIPEFSPTLPFSEIRIDNKAQIEDRIKYLTDNLSKKHENMLPMKKGKDYWMSLAYLNKSYLQMFSIQFDNNNLKLSFHPGNNKKQGTSLYSKDNTLSILDKKCIALGGENFELQVEPNIKISNNWGAWLAEVNIKNSNAEILRDIFEQMAKRWNKSNIDDIKKFEHIFSEYIDFKELIDEIQSINYNYFTISISIRIHINNLFDYFKEIDSSYNFKKGNDPLIDFIDQSIKEVLNLIEN